MIPPIYRRLQLRTFINARGTITTLGGSIMPPPVVEAMTQAAGAFVHLEELQRKAGRLIADLTGAEAAYICSGAASGMLLAGAAVLTGTDETRIRALPEVHTERREFVISLVDPHYYVHQGFRLTGGDLIEVGTRKGVEVSDYAAAMGPRTAALVFFLGSQPKSQLAELVQIAHAQDIPVIVDAAAQLPPRAHLTELPAMGVDLTVFSGGKGLFGPQSTGLILGREDLIQACALNSSPHSALGRGMKVGKEEIAGLLTAVELFFAQDEAAVVQDWQARCERVARAVAEVPGIQCRFTASGENRFPPASPLVHLHFADEAPRTASEVARLLEEGTPSILVSASESQITVGPQTLQPGEAEIIARRLREILSA